MRTLVAALALATAVPAAAQSSSLSAAQRDAYQESRLQIETVTDRRYRARWQPYGYDITDVSTTRWRGYVGDERVGELAFYHHAGADALAGHVASRRRRGWVIVAVGLAATGAGAAWIAASPDGDDNRFTETQLTGLGVSLTGVGVAALGVVTLSRNQTSLRDAVRAAEHFNRALEQTVRSRVPGG